MKILHHPMHPPPLFGKFSTLGSPWPGAMLLLCLLLVLSLCLCLGYGTAVILLALALTSLGLSDPSHSEVKASAISV